MQIALAQINPTVGRLDENCTKIIQAIRQAKEKECSLILFSEMALVGYLLEDLLYEPGFIEEVEKKLESIAKESSGIHVIVGTARKAVHANRPHYYDTAALFKEGKLDGFYDKQLLPTYDIFDEARFFTCGGGPFCWEIEGKRVGITICEDIWEHSGLLRTAKYDRDPIKDLIPLKPDLLINLSSSPYSLKKLNTRLDVGRRTALSLKCPVLLCNQVGANDCIIFDGYSFAMNACGRLASIAKGFAEDLLIIDSEKLTQVVAFKQDLIADLYQALKIGIRDYVLKTGHKTVCLGLSGGIDSALVACIAADAVGKDNVIALALPSRYSSPESEMDARLLAQNLGINIQALSIEEPFSAYLTLLQKTFGKQALGVTQENLQARVRGNLLMAYANHYGSLLLNTGNKSEMAMGYCTLYGDMSGALAVLGDVTKTKIYELVKFVNRSQEIIPKSIILKIPTAELKPNQKDSDTLPEYDILDQVLELSIEEGFSIPDISQKLNLSIEFVKDIVRRIHLSEHKRRQAPPILRVTEKALAPSSGRRVPIVQRWLS